MIKRFLAFLLDATETITISLSIFVMIYLFLGRPTQVLGYSMEPSLEPKQRLIVENVSLRFSTLQRGQIVVLHSPTIQDTDYIKRIIGIPGDTIAINNCKVFINNNLLDEPYLASNTCTSGGPKIVDNQPVDIPEGYYLVLGDNREHSYDGRSFGLIPKPEISGRAILRFWPPDMWKMF